MSIQELLVDVLRNRLILCDRDQYHSFVRRALVKQQIFHQSNGDKNAAAIIEAELNRLDHLHQPLSIAV